MEPCVLTVADRLWHLLTVLHGQWLHDQVKSSSTAFPFGLSTLENMVSYKDSWLLCRAVLAYVVLALIVDVADIEGLCISQVVCVPGGPVTTAHSTCLTATPG